ncbi:hypothetical protein C8243_02770 [Paracidovorax avenae]|nr:hypothetical protein C8243_02770 [Paracidovorax avenae]
MSYPLCGCAASPFSRRAAHVGKGDDASGRAKPVPRRLLAWPAPRPLDRWRCVYSWAMSYRQIWVAGTHTWFRR